MRLWDSIARFIGDIKWSGIAHPFWFIINAKGYQLKGTHYRELIKLLQPGDILIRRFEGYVDKFLIPGFWNHAGIYVGENEMVVHAVSDGVLKEDILNFMRTDHLIVLRIKDQEKIQRAIKKANAVVGKPYDFGFDFENNNRFSCTELIAYCYLGLVSAKRKLTSFGKKIIVADDIVASDNLEVIWDSRLS